MNMNEQPTTVAERGSNATAIESQRIETAEPIQRDDWTAADLLPMDTTL